MLRFGQLEPALAVEAGPHAGERASLPNPTGDVDAHRGVVHGQHPADRLHALESSDPRAGHHAKGRDDRFRHPLEQLARLAGATLHALHAPFADREGHVGEPAHHFHELRTAERAVQDRHVERIDHVLEVLEPIARHDRGTAAPDARIVGLDPFAGVEFLQTGVARQRRPALGRPHVGEDQAVAFGERVPGLAHVRLRDTPHRLARLVDAASFHVEHPPVIAAAETACLHLAVIETGAAMGAARMQQSGPPRRVAEQDERLSQRRYLPRYMRGVARDPDRVPVTPEEFSHGRVAPYEC